jgi:hypothetical protein
VEGHDRAVAVANVEETEVGVQVGWRGAHGVDTEGWVATVSMVDWCRPRSQNGYRMVRLPHDAGVQLVPCGAKQRQER